MGIGESAALRAAVLHLERYRSAIEAEINRRLGRGQPAPAVRAEVVRRFRTYCRLASFDVDTARPALEGLGGNDASALERVVTKAVEIAIECGPPVEVAGALHAMEERFRAGIRRVMHPPEKRERKRKGRRRLPNAGKRVRAAIDRISDAYLALNLDTGLIFDVNPAAEALLGTRAENLLEHPFAAIVAAQDRIRFRELEARLDAGEDAGPIEVVLERPNGDFVRVELMVLHHAIGAKRLAIFTARERLKEIA